VPSGSGGAGLRRLEVADPRSEVKSDPDGERSGKPRQEEDAMLAIAGTGYGLIGILVIILLIVLIFYYVRRV
jgi:hypothetical protein